jgi:hypothetical protein
VVLQFREQSLAIAQWGKQLFEIFLCESTIGDAPYEEAGFSTFDAIEC